jgi:hypothetical protein
MKLSNAPKANVKLLRKDKNNIMKHIYKEWHQPKNQKRTISKDLIEVM